MPVRDIVMEEQDRPGHFVLVSNKGDGNSECFNFHFFDSTNKIVSENTYNK